MCGFSFERKRAFTHLILNAHHGIYNNQRDPCRNDNGGGDAQRQKLREHQ
jgi:hypothetical protein